MRLHRRRLIASAAAVALTPLTSRLGHAAAWPTRAVKIIVPVAAGTATDLTARIFGEKLSAAWGQPVVIDNRPGADGLVAIRGFVTAHDDHTLLFSFSTAVSLNPLIYTPLPYDPVVDLVPITTTSEVLFGLAVNTQMPATTLKEFADYVRANPGKLNWAAAPGLPRFVLEQHLQAQKLDMVYVAYNQTPAAVTDLGEGRVQAMIGSVSVFVPILQTGKAKLLVIASTNRSALADGVPSAIEAGFPALAVPAVGCVYGWKGMSTDLRDRLAHDIDVVATDPAIVARLAQYGQVVRRSNPVDLAGLLAAQRVSLAPLGAAMAAARK